MSKQGIVLGYVRVATKEQITERTAAEEKSQMGKGDIYAMAERGRKELHESIDRQVDVITCRYEVDEL